MISLDALKLYIGALEDGDDADGILQDLELWAVSLVSRATGLTFGDAESVTVTMDTFGGVTLWLGADVYAPTAVYERYSLFGDWIELDTDAWEFGVPYSKRLVRVDGYEWPNGEALLKIDLGRGFSTVEAPQEIQKLVMDLVNFQYRAGRKLFLESGGSPDVSKVPGWDRVIAMYRAPNYA